MIAIHCKDYEATYSGSTESAFAAFLHHLDVHGTTPEIDGQAVELRDLWVEGLGSTERAMHLADSLGVTITR